MACATKGCSKPTSGNTRCQMSAQLGSRQMLRLVDNVQWWRSARSLMPKANVDVDVDVDVDAVAVLRGYEAPDSWTAELPRDRADVSAGEDCVTCPCSGAA